MQSGLISGLGEEYGKIKCRYGLGQGDDRRSLG